MAKEGSDSVAAVTGGALLEWLLTLAAGPAAVALPIGWAAKKLADKAQQWVRRYFRRDETSRFVAGLIGDDVTLTDTEFNALRRVLAEPNIWDDVVSQDELRLDQLELLLNAAVAPRDGLTHQQLAELAKGLIRALLEFDVAELEPDAFQYVLLARLERLEANQAARIDEVLLAMNADTAARSALDAQRYRSTIGHLRRVVDRLPLGPAGRPEMLVYLTILLDGLDVDPWPRIAQSGGPTITPSAIERRRRAQVRGHAGDVVGFVDGLAATHPRLVITGEPGSGKTWVARRIAREAARAARDGLLNGLPVDDVDIPLYASCASFFAQPGGARSGAIDAAVDNINDLGSNRLVESIKSLLGERTDHVLLVLDALDETPRIDARRLSAAAGITGWRFVLTSRPSHWADQIRLEPDHGDAVAELLPLSYPDDVDALIDGWYGGDSDAAATLKSILRERADLAKSATVPFVLASCCLISADGELPESRLNLYRQVIRHLLVGSWRDEEAQGAVDLDVDKCERQLQAWAWQAATSSPVSGLGEWLDEIPTDTRSPLNERERRAVDRVCPPIGRLDVVGQIRTRRFVHRVLQECLVAEHVAGLDLQAAADALLPHIWYDPDWQHAAPAAVAGHTERQRLLEELFRRAFRSTGAASDLEPRFEEALVDVSAIDACEEFRRFVFRTAAETDEADWPSLADAIGNLRLMFDQEHKRDGADVAWDGMRHWRTTTSRMIERRLGWLRQAQTSKETVVHALALAGLGCSEAQAAEVLDIILPTVGTHDQEEDGRQSSIQSLAIRSRRRHQTVDKLFKKLASGGLSWSAPSSILNSLLRIGFNDSQRAELIDLFLALARSTGDDLNCLVCVEALATLATSEVDQARVRKALLEEASKASSRHKMSALVEGIAQLSPTHDERDKTMEAFLNHLRVNGPDIPGSAGVLMLLEPNKSEHAQIVEILHGWQPRLVINWELATCRDFLSNAQREELVDLILDSEVP